MSQVFTKPGELLAAASVLQKALLRQVALSNELQSRMQAEVDANEQRSRMHTPHQGKKEIERRRKQLEREAARAAKKKGGGST